MFSVEVDASQLDSFHPKKMRDISPALHIFASYMQAQTDLMFVNAGGPGSAMSGGSYRGVHWEPLSTKYRRRPSGARVSASSALLQDTGTLRQMAAHEIVRITPTTMAIGTRLKYASWIDKKRPFLFVTEKDGDKFMALLDKYMDQQLGTGRTAL